MRTHAQSLRRTDYGIPRILPPADLERYCELIAALKVRTGNTKGRHLSTPEGWVVAPQSLLKKSTVNRYLATWGYDQRTLAVQQPVAHFQASYANKCWQFDVSPSDLKALPEPPVFRKNSILPRCAASSSDRPPCILHGLIAKQRWTARLTTAKMNQGP